MIAERDATIEGLESTITTMAEKAVTLQQEMAERKAAMEALQGELQSTIDQLGQQLEKKKQDLSTMQSRLVSAKETFDTEVVKKQKEISDLEGSLHQLEGYTGKMHGYVGQIQDQIRQREVDMKTQLALMKNTIAFALYIDETLQVDLTDPHSTDIMQRPMVVLPSGVTYSAETIEQIQFKATQSGQRPLCPQTGKVIEGVVPNVALESILARFLFKQQITQDVMKALHTFQLESGMAEEDQPLEAYMQQIKGHMVEKLHRVHTEQLMKQASEFTEVIEVKKYDMSKQERRINELTRDLAEATAENQESKKKQLAQVASYESQIFELRSEMEELARTKEALRAEREELMKDTTRLTDEVNKMGEAVADDGDALDARSDIAEINKLRKQDVLAARVELEACQEALATEQEKSREAFKERDEKDEALTELKREHAGAARLNEELQEEVNSLTAKLRQLAKENAQQVELTKVVQGKMDKAKQAADHSTLELTKLNSRQREQQHQLAQLQKDSDKLRNRLGTKEELVRSQAEELAVLRKRVDEMLQESTHKERLLAETREQALQSQQKTDELKETTSWLQAEKDRLSGESERRQAEINEKLVELLRAEDTVKQLQRRLDENGVAAAAEDESLTFHDMEALRKKAGVYAPLKTLPRVPVLATLQDVIGEQARDMAKIADERVGGMKATGNSAHEAALVIETRLPEEIEAEMAKAAESMPAAADEAAGGEGEADAVAEGGAAPEGGADGGEGAPAASVEGDASSEQPPQT